MRKVRNEIRLLFFLTSSLLLSSMMTTYELLMDATAGEDASVPMNRQLHPAAEEGDNNNGGGPVGAIRYSQLYQADPEKKAHMLQMLDEKQQILTRQRLEAIRSFHNSKPESQGQWTGALLDQMDDQMASSGKYAATRRAAFVGGQERRPKVIYFLHIHKSAGSTFCRQAYSNRMHGSYRTNCNVQPDQHCCGGEDSLQAQLHFASTTSYDVVASEREMYDAMAPEAYDYVVSLRDSKRRYYSHWNHLKRSADTARLDGQKREQRKFPFGSAVIGFFKDHLGALSALTEGATSAASAASAAARDDADADNQEHSSLTVRDYDGKRYPVGNYTEWWRGQPDNYNVRMICGAKCKYTPKYQLTEELFQYTLTRLSQFAHVFFVEDIAESFGRFADAYGWNSSVDVVHSYKHLEPSVLTMKVKDQHWDPFMSVLDDAMYEFARKRYENRTSHRSEQKFSNQLLVGEYFQTGLLRNCTNPCCGECSKW